MARKVPRDGARVGAAAAAKSRPRAASGPLLAGTRTMSPPRAGVDVQSRTFAKPVPVAPRVGCSALPLRRPPGAKGPPTRPRAASDAAATAARRSTSADRVRTVSPPAAARDTAAARAQPRVRPAPFLAGRCATATFSRPAAACPPAAPLRGVAAADTCPDAEQLSMGTAQRSTPQRSPESPVSMCSAVSTAASLDGDGARLPRGVAMAALDASVADQLTGDEARLRREIERRVDEQMRALLTMEEERREAVAPAPHLRLSRGDVLGGGRYTVVAKLGEGGYATVWLCWDRDTVCMRLADPTQQFVAVKVSRASTVHAMAAEDEAAILRYLRGAAPDAPVVRLLHQFDETRDGATFNCIVQGVCGDTLHTLSGEGYARWLVVGNTQSTAAEWAASDAAYDRHVLHTQRAIRGVLEGLATLRRLNAIHADLKPDNVLLTEVPLWVREEMRGFQEEMERAGRVAWTGTQRVAEETVRSQPGTPYVRLTDFGLSHVLRPRERRVVRIQTRSYRAPEVVMGAAISPAADMWSVGCIAYELLTGHQLVDRAGVVDTLPRGEQDQYHMDLAHALLGPESVLQEGVHRSVYYDDAGRYRNRDLVRGYLGGRDRRDLEEELHWLTRLPRAEVASAADFIRTCLGSADARKRTTPDACLAHPWLARRHEMPCSP